MYYIPGEHLLIKQRTDAFIATAGDLAVTKTPVLYLVTH